MAGFAVAVALSSCADQRKFSPAPGLRPTAWSADSLPSFVKKHAYQKRLDISGLAFFDSTLYVATNIGVLEVQGGHLRQILTWLPDDNVVSGPWSDPSGRQIWFERDHDNVFVRKDSTDWRQVALPEPPAGYYTRGEALEGFQAAGDSMTFRLVGAGQVWRWSADSAWVMGPQPTSDDTMTLVGFAASGAAEVYITSSGGCGYLPCTNLARWHTGSQWGKPITLAVGELGQLLSTTDGVFVRGTDGVLLRVGAESAVRLSVPGRCEAIARGSDGRLLASFRGAGIYKYDRTWVKLFDDPNPGSQGEQWAYLAEDHGQLAYGTTTVPQLDGDRQFQSGSLGLWVVVNGRLVAIDLAK